jgi:hypothetical protein
LINIYQQAICPSTKCNGTWRIISINCRIWIRRSFILEEKLCIR